MISGGQKEMTSPSGLQNDALIERVLDHACADLERRVERHLLRRIGHQLDRADQADGAAVPDQRMRRRAP